MGLGGGREEDPGRSGGCFESELGAITEVRENNCRVDRIKGTRRDPAKKKGDRGPMSQIL